MDTPCSTTAPSNGFSSVAWLTPAGGITSTAFGTVLGSTVQIGELSPGAQTPNVNSSGVAAKPRALSWSSLKPSWPVSTTVNAQPGPGVPSDAFETRNV